MAPESLAEKKYSPATDSYMFGILIWEVWIKSPILNSFVSIYLSITTDNTRTSAVHQHTPTAVRRGTCGDKRWNATDHRSSSLRRRIVDTVDENVLERRSASTSVYFAHVRRVATASAVEWSLSCRSISVFLFVANTL